MLVKEETSTRRDALMSGRKFPSHGQSRIDLRCHHFPVQTHNFGHFVFKLDIFKILYTKKYKKSIIKQII